MTDRCVGLSRDGPIVTGWGAMAESEDEVRELMDSVKRQTGGPA